MSPPAIFQRLRRFGIDGYLLLLFVMVLLGSVLPASGVFADVVRIASLLAVGLLFFLYGARLDTAAVVAGLGNWRLQGLVLATTYLAFPVAALLVALALGPWLDPHIGMGLLFLGALPSTVQSSIAFTALARGNVPAALCAASISNLLGVVLTPALCAVLLNSQGGINPGAIGGVALQILLPFVLGQLARRWIGDWVRRHRRFTLSVDRGSILLIVYSAFSAGMVSGVWSQVDGLSLALICAVVTVMLAAVLFATTAVGRLVGLPAADRLALLFCGSTKSLASGVPMAAILFAGQPVSLIILPIMLYHQLQLIVCAVIAQRHAALAEETEATAA